MEEFSKGMVVFEATTHIKIWQAAVGESLVCEREPENVSHRYAVAVKKELSYDICPKRYRGCVRCSCDEEVL